MKKIISVICAVLILISLTAVSFTAFAAVSPVKSLSVNPYGNAASSSDTVKMYTDADGISYLFLPAGADLSALTVWYTADSPVTVNGTALVNGAVTGVFSKTGCYTLKAGNSETKLYILKSENIPAVFLTTASGSLDYIHANKANKEAGTIKIVENGTVTLDSELKQIKGRGNSSWTLEKKPYNIKFDKKTNLFGMGKAKKWCLLASHHDKSLLKNKIAYTLADRLGLDFVSKTQHIDLYANGEYLGNYIVAESVEIGENRVDIHDLASDTEDANKGIDIESCSLGTTGKGPGTKKWVDIPADPADITGGYLLELDMASRFYTEISSFQTTRGQCVTVKEPEYASKAQVNYISSFYQDGEDAIFSETGYNSKGKHYSEYFDVGSLAKMYVLNEYMKNVDSGFASCFFYKDKGTGKLVASPPWDYDLAAGSNLFRPYLSSVSPDGWYASMFYYGAGSGSNYIELAHETVFRALYRYQADFRKEAAKQWDELSSLVNADFFSEINALQKSLSPSAVMNHTRWKLHSTAQKPDDNVLKYSNDVKSVTDFLQSRQTALEYAFSDKGAALYYDINGGTGNLVDGTVYTVGEPVKMLDVKDTAVEITPPAGKPYFVCWNTEKDGSGENYYPGEYFRPLKSAVTLYAQWSKTEQKPYCRHICHSEDTIVRQIWKFMKVFFRVFNVHGECPCGQCVW